MIFFVSIIISYIISHNIISSYSITSISHLYSISIYSHLLSIILICLSLSHNHSLYSYSIIYIANNSTCNNFATFLSYLFYYKIILISNWIIPILIISILSSISYSHSISNYLNSILSALYSNPYHPQILLSSIYSIYSYWYI